MASILPHLHKYGISKTAMHSALINRFEFTPAQRAACERYYILHWSGTHFHDVVSDAIIEHQGVRYLVVWKECKPTDVKPDSRLFLSFRKPAREFELQPYVLVSVAGSYKAAP
jgi:hypothetical protein